MISGYEHLSRVGVGSFTGGGKKLCLHTTEGGSSAGAISALDKNRSWSHFLLSYEEKRKIQFIEVNQSAKSLSNNMADGYQTNKANVVQVEIVGFAKDAAGWATAKLDWLAGCFSEIRQAWDFPLVHLDFKVPAVRLSDKAFVDYAGIVGHQHVPDNDHWDPGALNVSYIVSKMKGGNVSKDALTKEEFIVLHTLAHGTPPGAGYDGRYTGQPLSIGLSAVGGADGLQGTIAGKVKSGELIKKADCPKIATTPAPSQTIDVDAIAEAVVEKLKGRLES